MAAVASQEWAALTTSTDVAGRARELRRAHERVISGADAQGAIRALVSDSWRRSLVAGVAPDAPGAPVTLTDEELERARESSPLAPAMATILSTLSELGADAQYVVAIGDADANLLWVTGDPAAQERAREMGFQPGAAWAEESAGTNALGTAVALDHAVQIFCAEHLIAAVHPWTCSAAPIHDPGSARLIGVIDLTADLRSAHPHTLSIASLAARAAEATLRVHELEQQARIRAYWEAASSGRRGASLAVDSSGQVIASRRVTAAPREFVLPEQPMGAVRSGDGRVWELELVEGGGAILWLRGRSSLPRLSLRLLGPRAHASFGGRVERGGRSLELLAVLAMHPEGMTAEQLALALYGESGRTVTVRAQVHRLRAHLGEGLLDTHPYRLGVGVDGDWLRVRRLVREGRPAAALREYRGALLPVSDAPAIRDERALLEESLRCSLLTTGDAELLAKWVVHPSGADDLPAARTLVAVLPTGDPRRAAATAAAASIARRLR